MYAVVFYTAENTLHAGRTGGTPLGQRLADFYDGRAQAFRVLAQSGPAAAGAILHNVSRNELMAGLSPSAISFGREAEPPTQQLMSLLQTAIKR